MRSDLMYVVVRNRYNFAMQCVNPDGHKELTGYKSKFDIAFAGLLNGSRGVRD